MRRRACWRVSPWGLFAARYELIQALEPLGEQPVTGVYAWDQRRDGPPPPFAPPESAAPFGEGWHRG